MSAATHESRPTTPIVDHKSDDKVAEAAFDNKDAEKAFVQVADPDALELLSLITQDNPAHPIHWPLWKKWGLTIFYCSLQAMVTIISTDYLGVEFLIQERWGGTTQVVTLGQSMFIIGTAVGPAFLGPASDILGRKWLYVGAMFCFAILNIGVALPTGLPMLIIFMFLIGCAGSVALCNVAGTISDLFGDEADAGQPMALFVASANIGPSLGSPVGEWISSNPHMGFAWMGWLNVIMGGIYAIVMIFLPETLPRVVIANTAKKNGSHEGVAVALANNKPSVMKETMFVLTMAMKLMLFEPIILALGLYNGFAYGLLFLYLDGVFDVFVFNKGLSYIAADLTFLNFAVGVAIMFCTLVPLQTWLIKRDRRIRGVMRPEARFLISLVAVWGFPISLFWFAWTSGPGGASYWNCIIAGTLLGIVDPLLWMNMLTYITDSYPTVAGSAIAAFLIPSFLIAACCAHAGVALFDGRLSTQWAVSILAFISLGIVALVYILYFFGPKLRSRSRYARKF